MSMMGMDGKFPAAPGMGMEPPKEKTKLQKAMPLLHLVAMWCLLAYFVLWAEPKAYSEAVGVAEGQGAVSLWRRWAELGRKNPMVSEAMQTFRIQIVVCVFRLLELLIGNGSPRLPQPFFWAFTTLQIVLHSLRIFSGFVSSGNSGKLVYIHLIIFFSIVGCRSTSYPPRACVTTPPSASTISHH